MPEQCQHDCERGQQSADRYKDKTNFGYFMFRDQIRRQILKNVLQFRRAFSRVISAAGHLGDLLQCHIIDAAPKSSAAKLASTKLPSATKWIISKLPAEVAAVWKSAAANGTERPAR